MDAPLARSMSPRHAAMRSPGAHGVRSPSSPAPRRVAQLRYGAHVRLRHVLAIVGRASDGAGCLDADALYRVCAALEVVNNGPLHAFVDAVVLSRALMHVLSAVDERLSDLLRAPYMGMVVLPASRVVPVRLTLYALGALTQDDFDLALLCVRLHPHMPADADAESAAQRPILDFSTLVTFFAGLLAAQHLQRLLTPVLRAPSPRAHTHVLAATSPRATLLSFFPGPSFAADISHTDHTGDAGVSFPSVSASKMSVAVRQRSSDAVAQAAHQARRVLSDVNSDRFVGRPPWTSAADAAAQDGAAALAEDTLRATPRQYGQWLDAVGGLATVLAVP